MPGDHLKKSIKIFRFAVVTSVVLVLVGVRWIFSAKNSGEFVNNSVDDAKFMIKKAHADIVTGDAGDSGDSGDSGDGGD